MLPLPNQGMLAIAFFQASALIVLLVLFLLFRRDLPARFFRLWLAGWALFTLSSWAEVLSTLRGGTPERYLTLGCSLAAILFFGASVLEYIGRGRLANALWPVAGAGGLWVAFIQTRTGAATSQVHWSTALLFSGVLLASGWALWPYARARRSHGAMLLTAALWVSGLHGLDRPQWTSHPLFLLRMAFDHLLGVSLGIAMTVLALETARARTEDLNDKLRRLTLITAASTQSFNVDEMLRNVLSHLVESLGATHGVVRLLEGEGNSAGLVLRASVGFDAEFHKRNARVSVQEGWPRKVLAQETSFLSFANEEDPAVRRRMEADGIADMILVSLPGKDGPLGILAVGANRPKTFQADEVTYLVNVGNLLGLTIQNLKLFEQVSTAQKQWTYTFDSIGDPILVHDPQGRILRANYRLADRLGRSADGLLGWQVTDVLPHATHGWSQCPYCEGAAGEGDDPDPFLGGYFLASTSNFHNPAGERLGIVHVLKDITDRKRAEERYRTLVENVQEGVFISTPQGRFLDFNDAFLRMLGYTSREELLNVDIATMIYLNPADRERLKRLLRDHGSVADFEFQLRRKDGEVRTVLETSFATRDASGNVIAFQGFVLDITERKHAEQEIRRRNHELMVLNSIGQTLSQALELPELLHRALRQMVELFALDLGSIYLLEDKSNVVRRLAAVGHRTEYARHFPAVALSAELIDHIRMVHATVLSATSLPLPAEFRDLQRREGVADSHVVVLWSKDHMLGALVVGSRKQRDFAAAELNLLTSVGNQIAAAIEKSILHEETRKAYENLRRTQEQLLQSEKMAALGQLISGVAHELNNPLTAILGYSQLLVSSEDVSPRGAEYVEKLYKQAQRTHRIVGNLLSFARQQKPERRPVQVNQILEDTLALREYDLKLNNIQVHRDLSPHARQTAADPHQLQQVFLNILNNAVDAVVEAGSPGEVWVRTAEEKDRLVIEFADNGRGVQDTLRVFDPFYTTKPVGKGTGLGLSICYGIIKEHGGEISVRNAPPRGAVFTISLPLLAVAGSPERVGAAKDEIRDFGRVLLVDDEEAVLELEQEILAGRCQSVNAFRSGEEAQKWLESESADLVITDLKMPGKVSGWGLYEWICRQRPELAPRVVFTMSDARAEEINTLLRTSGCLFIQKPFDLGKFLGVLRLAVGPSSVAGPKR